MARVEGFEANHSGQQPIDDDGDPAAVGVWGDSDVGTGVFGSAGVIPANATPLPLDLAGVAGHGFGRPGVNGESDDSLGVLGRSRTATGMLGVTFDQSGEASGVFGSSTANGNGVTGFVGSRTGVVGNSVRGTGVRGVSTGIGVFGESVRGGERPAPGVLGTSIEGSGVQGSSESGSGVRGSSTASNGTSGVTFGSGVGASGLHFSEQPGSGVSGTSVFGWGVDGFSFTDTGVRGGTTSGLAGDFDGDVRVTGALLKSGGGFEIDHPVEPATMYLAHSFVESPEMLNVYSGTVVTDESGDAEVRLPDYFEALNSDYRYQLTVIGEFAQAIVAREVEEARFAIRTDRPRMKVCWQVTGVRQDPWAKAHRIPVESQKSDADRGRYLHPEVQGGGGQAIRSMADEARRRVIDMLPESLRDRGEAVLTTAGVDLGDLQELVDEAAQEPTRPERTEPGRLEDDWRALQESLRRWSREGDGAGA